MNKFVVVCFGEVLWDSLIDGRRLGGAPLNVCYHLMKMGVPSTIITQIGDDQNGEDIINEFDRLQISKTHCQVSDRYPTSTVEVHLGENNKVNYEIVEKVAWDYISYSKQISDLVEGSAAFVFGSLVVRSSVSRETLMRLIDKSSYRVFDVNLRKPFYDRDTLLILMSKANLLKLNEDELEVIGNWLSLDVVDEDTILSDIMNRFESIAEILLTKGAEGAVYYSREQKISVPAYKITVKDTVGSGDSFLAAFIAKRLLGQSVEEALHAAVLLSAYVARRNGACPIYNVEDLKRFEMDYMLQN